MNSLLTKQVIDLHARGYHLDFAITADYGVLCIQSNSFFLSEAVELRLAAQGFDQLSCCQKYVYTVETFTGEQGLLMADVVFCGNR
ncbi:hypothetical protein EZ456_12965 [Pedobacter psychrodurus]|uniref:Uncharacterized protein n=1 Tax=Pedobacter psychrodurus TaxID=2530456 RepID=A0A4R0PV92_9SPHI|nr:hypothetical protein [Pedobacter psychrodurus]TCD26499.1 hypothetical protein EZ456_12965 [Pedobacter psychrodurus]